MRRWYVPLTVLGLGGVSAFLLSERGRTKLRAISNGLQQAPDRLLQLNNSLQSDLDRIQAALDRIADSARSASRSWTARRLFDHVLKQVSFQLRLAGLARRGQVIHLDRTFQALAETLSHPLKQRLLRGVLLEGQVLLLEALLADLDARGDRRRRDKLTIGQHEVGSVVIQLLHAMRRDARAQVVRDNDRDVRPTRMRWSRTFPPSRDRCVR